MSHREEATVLAEIRQFVAEFVHKFVGGVVWTYLAGGGLIVACTLSSSSSGDRVPARH